MNYQTREKITNIRTSIENGATVEEIDKSYFKTKTIKITFLSRNKNYFSNEELVYLQFDPETNTLLEKTNKLTELEVSKNDTPNKITKSKKVRSKSEDKPKDFFDFVDEEKTKDFNFDYVDEEIEVEDETKKTSDLTKLETPNNNTSNQLTKLETEFFKDTENLKALVEIVKKYRSQQEAVEIIENGIIHIPAEAKLKLDRNLAVKTNGELYDKIVDLAYKNKVGKGEFVTYILWEFLKKHS